ncbi:hypothetical protein ACLB2K_068861 [Fragaria x ananassa]
MEGTIDTEMAMGSYQPHHAWARNHCSPLGIVANVLLDRYLDIECHCGQSTQEPLRTVLENQSLECVRRVRAMGELNWKQFAAEEVTEMRGHLLKYPVEIDRKGKVTSLPGCESFPDAGGNITGSFLGIQENLTI